MIRAELTVAAIALVATVAVALNGTSPQAQTQTASPEPTIWDHNGSVMYLVANGPVSGVLLSKASHRNVGGRCTSWLSSLPR